MQSDPVAFVLPTQRPRRSWLLAAMVVLIVLGAISLFAVPTVVSNNVNANESAVIAILKNVSSAQAQIQGLAAIDVDRDGCGEYGFLAELAGRAQVRGRARRVSPALLSTEFGLVRNRRVVRDGYVFQLFLPDRDGLGVTEDERGGDPENDGGVDPDRAERSWCCYAWPLHRGWTGRRAFFVSQTGNVLATNGELRRYDGTAPCAVDAAFAAATSGRLDGEQAVNAVGRDGNQWVIIS
ncbi:MAG: hypothetical protein U1E73_04020 [Planctomycetota bacterium]